MAENLKKEYGVEPQISTGRSGFFEVKVNGETIFSKLKEGRFPKDQEIVEIIQNKQKNS